MNLNKKELETSINKFWDDSIVPTLIEYIKIPNKSPSFDPDWKRNGHMDKVLVMAVEWAKKHMPEEAELTTKESPGRTPIILIDVPSKIYPELRRIFVSLFEGSGFKDIKINETVDFEKLYKMKKAQ